MKQITTNLISLLFIVGLYFNTNAQNTWTQKKDFPANERSQAYIFEIDSTIYTVGGVQNSRALRVTWKYNQKNDSWSQFDSLPERLVSAANFSIGNKGYLCNPIGLSGSFEKKVYEFDAATGKWTRKNEFAGAYRYSSLGFSANNKGYILFGEYDNKSGGSREVWEYDNIKDSWTQKKLFIGGERTFPIGFSIGNIIYVGGGRDKDNNYYRDFYAYDVIKDEWTKKNDLPDTTRAVGVGFAMENKGYIGLGIKKGGEYLNDFWQYSPDDDTWLKIADFPAEHRFYSSVGVIKDRAYLLFGDGDVLYKDVWEYSFNKIDTVDSNISSVIILNELNNIKVYPSEKLLVVKSDLEIQNLQIFDMNGRNIQIYRKDDEFDISTLTQGIYIYNIQFNNGNIVNGKFYMK